MPMSHENVLLAFKPGRFFYELSKISGHRESTLRSAYNRAHRRGLIEQNAKSYPRLTKKGRIEAAPFVSHKLSHRGKLLVIFDIPENKASLRRELRTLLKRLGFVQVQLSVWVTDMDYRTVIIDAVTELELEGYVEFYEAARLFPV